MLKPYSECKTDGERNAYKRGYNTGSAGQWPRELTKTVPDKRVSDLAMAAESLESAVDTFMAQFDDRDECKYMIAIDEARDRVRASILSLPDAVVDQSP